MAYKNSTENFYREIIQKVCDQVKEDFHNEGVGEDVIQDLRKAWMEKLVQNGIFQRQMPNFLIKSFVDPGLIPNTNMMRYHGHMDITRGGGAYIPNLANPHMQSANYFKSDPNKTTTDNINEYLEKKNTVTTASYGEIKPKFTTVNTKPVGNGHSAGNLGSNAAGSNGINLGVNINIAQPGANNPQVGTQAGTSLNFIKKNEDEESEVDSDLDIFEGKEKLAQVKKEEEGEGDEESLSSMSNDSEFVEAEPKDILLAQYEKVHRVRNKWKCTFKDAVLHINGREYVFEKVIGELERDW